MAFAFSDLIVPEVVTDVLMVRLGQQSPFISAGLVAIDNAAAGGGNFATRRIRDEDTTSSLVIDGNTSHTATILGAVADIAPVLRRVRPRMIVDGTMAAEGRLSANPTDDTIRQSATYWAREADEVYLSVLTALFDPSAGCLRTTHLEDLAAVSGTAVPLSYGSVVQAATLAGDSIGAYQALVVHSRVWASLQLENAAKATFLPLGGSAPVPFLGSLRVIVSDAVPTSGSGAFEKFTSILLRPGALWLSTQQSIKEFVAPDPSIPAVMISESWHFAASVEGVKWSGALNPTNAALATAASWAKTAPIPSALTDKRQIGVIGITTNAATS